ncbi:MAG TPA: hypothetical protein VGL74_09345 [Terriglobales bacterium]|jgi:hypothetical protein
MTNFAEEQHGSVMWAFVMIVPAFGMLLFAGNVPLAGIRLTLIVSAITLFAAAAMAWSGFHYSFSPAGIEIRTLGFRVRSISAADIRSYAVDRWNVIGGYGIRGLGNRRAYVWGNNGVRIKTTQGEVFLGHSEPEKIIRDLDLVTRNHEASEAGIHS